MPTEAFSLIDFITKGTLAVALLVTLFGGYLEWWYYGPNVRKRYKEYEEACQKDRALYEESIQREKARADRFEAMVFRLLDTNDRLIDQEQSKLGGRT